VSCKHNPIPYIHYTGLRSPVLLHIPEFIIGLCCFIHSIPALLSNNNYVYRAKQNTVPVLKLLIYIYICIYYYTVTKQSTYVDRYQIISTPQDCGCGLSKSSILVGRNQAFCSSTESPVPALAASEDEEEERKLRSSPTVAAGDCSLLGPNTPVCGCGAQYLSDSG
ncbi:hypothetical protein O6P43_001803, partial [Quillaja saponaria]